MVNNDIQCYPAANVPTEDRSGFDELRDRFGITGSELEELIRKRCDEIAKREVAMSFDVGRGSPRTVYTWYDEASEMMTLEDLTEKVNRAVSPEANDIEAPYNVDIKYDEEHYPVKFHLDSEFHVGTYPKLENKPEEDEMSDQDDSKEYFVIPVGDLVNYRLEKDYRGPLSSAEFFGDVLEMKRKLPVTDFSDSGLEKLSEIVERLRNLDQPQPNTTLEIKDGHLENMARTVFELMAENHGPFDGVKISEATLLNFRDDIVRNVVRELNVFEEQLDRIEDRLAPKGVWTQPIKEALAKVGLPGDLKAYQANEVTLSGTLASPTFNAKGAVLNIDVGGSIDYLARKLTQQSKIIWFSSQDLVPIFKRLALLEKAHGKELDVQAAAKASKPGLVTRAKGALGKIALVASGAGLAALGGLV